MFTDQEIAVEAANRSPKIDEAWQEINQKRQARAHEIEKQLAEQRLQLETAKAQFEKAINSARGRGPEAIRAVEARYAQRIDEITGKAAYDEAFRNRYRKQHGHDPDPVYYRGGDSAGPGGLGSSSYAIHETIRSEAQRIAQEIQGQRSEPTSTFDFRAAVAGAFEKALQDLRIEQKSFRGCVVERKGGLPVGQVEAIVSVSLNEDLGGDIVQPGAFEKFIGNVKSGYARMPRLCWSHKLEEGQIIGKVVDIEELAPGSPMLPPDLQAKGLGGLWVRTQFNRNTQLGRDAYELVKDGSVDSWSFMYLAPVTEIDRKGRRLLKEINPVIEISPVGYGMNQEARTSALPDAEAA